jgi:hypothetical protein
MQEPERELIQTFQTVSLGSTLAIHAA